MRVNNINVSLNNIQNDQNVGVKLVHLTGNKDTSVFAIELAANQFIPAHYHKVGIETYFILSGEGIIHLGRLRNGNLFWEHKIKVTDGDCFSIEPNQVHKFENNSDQILRIIGTAPLTHTTEEDRFFVRPRTTYL
ncbi:MAG: cupin domain-containing protein [Flavobacteriaceae bacterium]|jgi:mannose-6-phosphate isomerase-like protein (cupin superfamily)|nr:cupin domain-containing protein [Flavobacteriaceae bacterium]